VKHIGVHAILRWTETARLVGPKGIAELSVTLRTTFKPEELEKAAVCSSMLRSPSSIVIDKVQLTFTEGIPYILNPESFAKSTAKATIKQP